MQLQWLRLQSFIVVVVINWVPHKLIFTRKENQTNEEKKKKKKSHTKKIYIFFCLSFWLFLLFYRCFVSFDSITVDVAMYFKLNMEWGFSRCFFFLFFSILNRQIRFHADANTQSIRTNTRYMIIFNVNKREENTRTHSFGYLLNSIALTFYLNNNYDERTTTNRLFNWNS